MESFNENMLNEDVNDYTPEDIALALFSEDPKEPCSHQILAYQEGADLTYIFEILITILMEGLQYLAGDLTSVNLKDFSYEHIEVLEPWFEAIGFKMNITVYDNEYYGKYYCKVVLNTDENKHHFELKNLDKNYHFLLNGVYFEDNKNETDLKNLYCLFKNNDLIYRISFNFYQFSNTNQ